MSHNNPIPVAVCLIPISTGERQVLLGIIRGNGPGTGGLAYPGGYVDPGEDAAMAASRECQEETGLLIEPSKWKLLNSRITPENRLLLFLSTDEVFSHEILPSLPLCEEVQGFRLVDADSELVFPTHQDFNRAWFSAAA